jgi:hypothetical protein
MLRLRSSAAEHSKPAPQHQQTRQFKAPRFNAIKTKGQFHNAHQTSFTADEAKDMQIWIERPALAAHDHRRHGGRGRCRALSPYSSGVANGHCRKFTWRDILSGVVNRQHQGGDRHVD